MNDNIPKYNEITKAYIYKWRELNPDKYNEYHRKYYSVKKEDPVWREKHNKRCREYNRRYAEKKRGGEPVKPRGRPKKPTDFISLLEEKFNGEDIDITDEVILLN